MNDVFLNNIVNAPCDSLWWILVTLVMIFVTLVIMSCGLFVHARLLRACKSVCVYVCLFYTRTVTAHAHTHFNPCNLRLQVQGSPPPQAPPNALAGLTPPTQVCVCVCDALAGLTPPTQVCRIGQIRPYICTVYERM